MRVSVETTAGLGRKATVAVPSETFEAEVADRLKERAATLKLPGFRPGRVPMKEVRRRFDRTARAEAAQTIVQSSLPDVLAEQRLDVVGVPQVELLNTAAGNDFEYAATFEVLPTFELKPFEALRIRRPVAEIAETDVDDTVELLREKQAQWVEVRRAARKKDRVTVDYAVRVGGEIRSEGTDKTLVVGGWFPVAGLPETVLGMAPGETRTFPVAVLNPTRQDAAEPPVQGAPAFEVAAGPPAAPEAAASDVDDRSDGSAGDANEESDEHREAGRDDRQEGVGEVTVKRVEEPHLPALDDGFFDELGIEPGPDRKTRFRTQVENRMRSELDAAVGRAIRQEMSDVLGRAHSFDLPVAMVREELTSRTRRLGETVKLDSIPESFQRVMLLQANSAVRLDLVLGKVAQVADISLDQDRLKARVKEIASNFEDEAAAERAFYADQEQLQRVAAVVVEDQAIEHVLAHANVVDVPCTYAEAIAGQGLPPLPRDAEAAASEAEAREEGAPDNAGPTAAAQTETGPAQPDAAGGSPKGGLVGRLRQLVGRDREASPAQGAAKESSR